METRKKDKQGMKDVSINCTLRNGNNTIYVSNAIDERVLIVPCGMETKKAFHAFFEYAMY